MIEITRHERVVHLVLNAPPVNVLDAALLGELIGALRELAEDDTIAALVLSGHGKCFSAGASVAEHAADKADGMLTALTQASTRLADFPAPVVAAVHGVCLGGAPELISFCDFVVAAPDAKFGQPEIKLAFFPPVACYQLPRLTGRQNAAWLMLTGETVDAERALGLGLAQKILPTERWSEIDDLFNGLSVAALRVAKRAIALGASTDREQRLDDLKQLFLSDLYQLEDVAEGLASFRERRAPVWKHR